MLLEPSLHAWSLVSQVESLRILHSPIYNCELSSCTPQRFRLDITQTMIGTRSLPQLRFYFLGLFCLLMVSITGTLLRHRLQVSDSRPFSDAAKPLQNTLPTASGALQKPKTHHPSLTASGSNYGLSRTECRAEFPNFFNELDRSVALRRARGNVSLADVDLSWKPYGGVRVMIHNHKVLSFLF